LYHKLTHYNNKKEKNQIKPIRKYRLFFIFLEPELSDFDLGTGKLINKPLSSIFKAFHFFLFTSIFKKIFFNSRVKKIKFFFEKLPFSNLFFYISKGNIHLFKKNNHLTPLHYSQSMVGA